MALAVSDHNLSPEAALRTYRRVSRPEIVEQASLFAKLPEQERSELLFYMAVHQANAMADIGGRVGADVTEIQETQKDN